MTIISLELSHKLHLSLDMSMPPSFQMRALEVAKYAKYKTITSVIKSFFELICELLSQSLDLFPTLISASLFLWKLIPACSVYLFIKSQIGLKWNIVKAMTYPRVPKFECVVQSERLCRLHSRLLWAIWEALNFRRSWKTYIRCSIDSETLCGFSL